MDSGSALNLSKTKYRKSKFIYTGAGKVIGRVEEIDGCRLSSLSAHHLLTVERGGKVVLSYYDDDKGEKAVTREIEWRGEGELVKVWSGESFFIGLSGLIPLSLSLID